LPGGYHITQDNNDVVRVHQDAHDPLLGRKETIDHNLKEAWRSGKKVNLKPDWK
jgi:hypothetical protein